jgi:hypothetical protein
LQLAAPKDRTFSQEQGSFRYVMQVNDAFCGETPGSGLMQGQADIIIAGLLAAAEQARAAVQAIAPFAELTMPAGAPPTAEAFQIDTSLVSIHPIYQSDTFFF